MCLTTYSSTKTDDLHFPSTDATEVPMNLGLSLWDLLLNYLSKFVNGNSLENSVSVKHPNCTYTSSNGYFWEIIDV